MGCVEDKITSGSVDGGLRQYDLRKGELTNDDLYSPVGSINFSRDGQCILVSTLNDTIHLLETGSGTELAQYKGHVNRRYKVQSAFDPANAFVASGSEDHHVCFWEL